MSRAASSIRFPMATRMDAELAVRWHYFPADADQSSSSADYYCEEGGVQVDEAVPVYIECVPIQGMDEWPTMLVKPNE